VQIHVDAKSRGVPAMLEQARASSWLARPKRNSLITFGAKVCVSAPEISGTNCSRC